MIDVVDFPAVIIVDDKGHDFFADILRGKQDGARLTD
jgi:tartrate dehydratase beta subunit/fumarate hydratase class I family protein